MARITLYDGADFKGASKDVTTAVAYIGGFNDRVSSFIVREGTWQFYRDTDFENPVGRPFKKGEKVSWVEAVGIPNDAISSLQPIKR